MPSGITVPPPRSGPLHRVSSVRSGMSLISLSNLQFVKFSGVSIHENPSSCKDFTVHKFHMMLSLTVYYYTYSLLEMLGILMRGDEAIDSQGHTHYILLWEKMRVRLQFLCQFNNRYEMHRKCGET